ncbi:hypothetical protein PROFUN_07564 [Planoprotostelium fungivorum]|uniref:Uncharacterized protein n=1 Tax=Planoprotostelium fungivorum TaxID=1890364 RepID=A0A2P6NLS1_9EUKA|nr:hypothetical protein PROFUN_07564 [Planoprotostelium fungivorum]
MTVSDVESNHSGEEDTQPLVLFIALLNRDPGTQTEHSWHIDNRYYSVDLIIQVIGPQDKTRGEELSNACGAIVLFFDGSEASFDRDVKPWGEYFERVEPSVGICIACKTTDQAPTGTEDLYSRFNSWSIDHGIEFVPSYLFDQEEEEEETLGVERIGLDRVVEALQSNTWPGMEYKTQSRPTASRLTETYSTQDTDIAAAITAAVDGVQTPATLTTSTEVDREAHLRMDDLLVAMEEPSEGSDSHEMKQLEAFERALRQLDQVRNRAQGLPDRERRELAAKVALSFLSEMGDSSEEDM